MQSRTQPRQQVLKKVSVIEEPMAAAIGQDFLLLNLPEAWL